MDYDNATDHLDTTEYDDMVEYFGTTQTPDDLPSLDSLPYADVFTDWDEYGYMVDITL